MAADPLKRRGEAGMSIFLWSFPMDFWEDATAPVAHLGRKLSFCASSGGERTSHRSAHWCNPRDLDPEFLPGVAGTSQRAVLKVRCGQGSART